MAEIPADEFLAPAVIDRRVDQVDPPVEHRIEEPAGLLVVNRRSPWPASQFHGPVPEDGHVRSGPPQRARLDRHDRTLSRAAALARAHRFPAVLVTGDTVRMASLSYSESIVIA